MGWVEAQQGSEKLLQLLTAKAVNLEAELNENAEQSLDADIVERKGGHTPVFDKKGTGELFERLLADHAVMRDGLDVEKTSVGCKADAAKSGEIRQVSSNVEVVRVVDGGFGAQTAAFLEVLFEVR